MTALIDYNMGNIKSVLNAIEAIGEKAIVVRDADELKNYPKVLLPGVGAFGDAMKSLKQNGMDEAIVEFVKSGKSVLGICLGMQLLFDKSEEFGQTQGLGLIEGDVVLFDKEKFDEPLKIPHIGWNTLHVKKEVELLKGVQRDLYLYFVHSYHVKTKVENVVGTTFYGYEFASMVARDNVYGFQPHPEKSHDNGLKILKNFMEM